MRSRGCFPRLRGDEPASRILGSLDFWFPAYAGMSPCLSLLNGTHFSFPRLRGDEPDELAMSDLNLTFSPPTRG